jgi:hypothetical protein
MSFLIAWPEFDDALLAELVQGIEESLNHDGWSSLIIGPIRVKNLNPGKIVRLISFRSFNFARHLSWRL